MIYNRLNLSIAALAPTDRSNFHRRIRLCENRTEVTNGHYLVVVQTPDLEKGDLPMTKLHKPLKAKRIDTCISAEAANAALRAIPSNGCLPIIRNAWLGSNTKADMVELITTDLETWKPIVTRMIEGKFPDTAKLMKDNHVGKAKWRSDVWVSPVYLRKLCDLFIRAGVKDFKLSIKDADSAMRLMARNGETDQLITALLMPVQGDDERLSSSRSKPRKKKPVEQPPVEVAAQVEEPEVQAPEEPIDEPAQMDEPEDPPAEDSVVETPAPPRRKRKSAKKSAEKEA